MALIRWTPRREVWDPFDSLTEIHNEMDRLFGRSLRSQTGLEGVFSPAIDVAVEKDNVIIKADLPGLTRDDVSVTLQENYLTIKGEKKQETEKKETNYFLSERVHGLFTRVIELPVAVETVSAPAAS